jgi:hypothetical protein
MTSLLSIAIFQHHQRMEFTFHSPYVILELVFSDFLDRVQLLTPKRLKQGYVAPKLKSSLQKCYSRHHFLVDRYELTISQMTMNLLLCT